MDTGPAQSKRACQALCRALRLEPHRYYRSPPNGRSARKRRYKYQRGAHARACDAVTVAAPFERSVDALTFVKDAAKRTGLQRKHGSFFAIDGDATVRSEQLQRLRVRRWRCRDCAPCTRLCTLRALRMMMVRAQNVPRLRSVVDRFGGDGDGLRIRAIFEFER